MDFGLVRLGKWCLFFLLAVTSTVAVSSGKKANGPRSPPDGLGQAACQTPGCLSQTLDTARGGDAIILLVGTGSNVTSLADSSGLGFSLRISYKSTTFHVSMWEYDEFAESPLTSDFVTVAVEGVVLSCEGWDVSHCSAWSTA